MKKSYWIVFFFILCSVLGLSTVPASWAVYSVQQILPNWQVFNVSGSLWRGSAQNNQLLIDNKPFPLGQLKWQLNPLELLRLRLCVSFSSRLQRQTLLANACFSLINRKLQLQDSQLVIDVAALEPWLTMRLRGNAYMMLKSIVIKNKHFYDIDGAIAWRQAQFHNSRTWIDLGELEAYLTDDNAGGLRSQLTNATQGPLTVNLIIQAPKSGGLWLSGKIIPTATAQPVIHETLQIVGKSDNQGGYTIDWIDR